MAKTELELALEEGEALAKQSPDAPQSALDQALNFGAARADDAVSFLQSAAEGATMGLYAPFQKYVGGAAEYATQNIMGNNVSFEEAVERIGGERARQREENPLMTLGGEVVGAGALGVAAGPALLPASAMGRGVGPMFQRVVGSSVYGGAENAALNLFQGESETAGEVGGDIALGMLGGALGQGAIEGGGAVLGALANRGAFGSGVVAGQAEKALARNLFEAPTPGGEGLRSQLEMGEQDLLTRAISQEPGEVVGDLIPSITAKTAALPSTAGVTEPLLRRSQSILDRQYDLGEEVMLKHFNPQTDRTLTKEVYDFRRAELGETYVKVLDDSVNSGQSFRVGEVLDTLKSARPGSVPEGAVSVFNSLEKYVKGPDILNADGVIDARGLLNLKKSIDARIKENVIQATDKETRNLLLAAKKNVNEMLGQVDGYSAVAREFSDEAAGNAANQLGREAFKPKISSDEVNALMKDMSPDELFNFRSGMLTELRELAIRSGEPNFIAKNFTARATPIRRKLEVVFGNKKLDAMLKDANKLSTDITNAGQRVSAIEGRGSPVGTSPSDFEQATQATVLGSGLVASGGAPSVTVGASGGKLAKLTTAADRKAQQNLMEILQQPRTSGNLMNLMKLKELEKTMMKPGATGLVGGAGGIIPSSLLDRITGAR